MSYDLIQNIVFYHQNKTYYLSNLLNIYIEGIKMIIENIKYSNTFEIVIRKSLNKKANSNSISNVIINDE